jgi:vacuolar iron transporter family protein
MTPLHKVGYQFGHIGWLGAAERGANDGTISTASLILGVASPASHGNEILADDVAGPLAGALSIAAGEHVSVGSQSNTEHAHLELATREHANDPEREKEELAQIYADRGVKMGLARQVALQLLTKDALGAHSRDEHRISESTTARPLRAATASAASFKGSTKGERNKR